MAGEDGHGPYQQDPFTHIVEIHFPGGITKLDFVHGRYMVQGLAQNFDEVLGDDLSSGGITLRDGATQRGWRVDNVGLDLRETDGSGRYTEVKGQAFLKNKTATPDKKNPGALNETLRNNYTLVLEFDWEDVLGHLQAESPGGFDDGFDVLYDIMYNVNRLTEEGLTISNAELIGFVEGIPAHDVTTTVNYFPVGGPGPYYDTGFTDASEAADFYFNYNPEVAGSIVNYKIKWDTGTIWMPAENFDLVGAPYGAGPATLYTDSLSPGGFDPDTGYPYGEVLSETLPPPHVTVDHIPAIEDDYPYTITPELAVFETNSASTMINGRIVGAAPDAMFETRAPITDGNLPAPYGRIRLAMTIDGNRLAASVNGGAVAGMTAPALFSRPYSAGTGSDGKPIEYYKIEPDPSHPFQKTYEAYFSFVGIVRCMWISRKKYKDADLIRMSQIKPLPLATDPKWKKMAGFDQ